MITFLKYFIYNTFAKYIKLKELMLGGIILADNNEIFDLLNKMYSDLTQKIDNVNSEMQEIEQSIKKLDTKMDKGFDEVNVRIDTLSIGIGKMITNEVAEELSDQLRIIKSDVKFVKHKVQETEEDVFTIQSHLKIIK